MCEVAKALDIKQSGLIATIMHKATSANMVAVLEDSAEYQCWSYLPSKALKFNIYFISIYLVFLKDCWNSVVFKVTNAPSHFETLWSKMFVANIMVSRWCPVFPTHVPQPLLQPVCVLQRKPGNEDQNVRSFPTRLFKVKYFS